MGTFLEEASVWLLIVRTDCSPDSFSPFMTVQCGSRAAMGVAHVKTDFSNEM